MHESSRVRRRVDEREARERPRATAPSEHALLALQQSAGNRATCAALQRFWINAGGSYRWEADQSKQRWYRPTPEMRWDSWWNPWSTKSPVFVQGLTDEQVRTIESGVAGLETDVASRYPIVAEVLRVAAAAGIDGKDVRAVLSMAVIAYHNAARLRAILDGFTSKPDRTDAVDLLFSRLDAQPWASRSLLQVKHRTKYVADPQSLEDDLRFVLGYVIERWDEMSGPARTKLVNRLFNHQKGYDSAYDDAMQIEQIRMLGAGPDNIVREWLKGGPNTNPWTGTGLGASSGGGVSTRADLVYDRCISGPPEEAEKKVFFAAVVSALVAAGIGLEWSQAGPLQAYLDENIDEIAGALADVHMYRTPKQNGLPPNPAVGAALAADARTFLSDIADLFA